MPQHKYVCKYTDANIVYIDLHTFMKKVSQLAWSVKRPVFSDTHRNLSSVTALILHGHLFDLI